MGVRLDDWGWPLPGAGARLRDAIFAWAADEAGRRVHNHGMAASLVAWWHGGTRHLAPGRLGLHSPLASIAACRFSQAHDM